MDRNSNKWYGDDQIVIRGASIEDAVAIMQIWNNNISNTFNTFNSRIKTETEIIEKILESTKKRFGFFVEGRTINTPFMGKVKYILKEIRDGLQSSCSYVGANNLEEFHKSINEIDSWGYRIDEVKIYNKGFGIISEGRILMFDDYGNLRPNRKTSQKNGVFDFITNEPSREELFSMTKISSLGLNLRGEGVG